MNSVTSKILKALLVICVATSLITIGFHIFNNKYKTETAILSTADESAAFKGVYIRSEEVVQYGGTGAVSYCVPDGGKLGSGSAIAEIYADESQIDIKQQINDLNDELEVLKKIQNPGTVESAQPSNISELIDEQYKTIIYNREIKNISDFTNQKNEFLVLLSTYRLVTDPEADFSARINSINSQIASLKASETIPLDTIVADHSAYFVSYADGYEDTLTKDRLSSLTPELIDEVKDSGPVEDNKVIGKLINGYEWYVAGVIDNRKLNFSAEDEVKIKFQSTSDTVDGVISDIRDTKDPGKNIVIIKCSEMTYNMVQHRTERVEMISGEYEGIKVPRKAIRFTNMEEKTVDEKTGEESTQTVNCRGVYVKFGERISFKKIDTIYEGDDYVLSAVNAGDGYLALYDDIVVDGVDAYGN